MAEWVKLKAADGHELDAYVVRPAGEPKAALVVVQEIFGVNKQIQGAADKWAADGYLVIAPAMFDRMEKHVNLGYDKAGWDKAMQLAQQINFDNSVKDLEAAVNWLRGQTQKKVGVVGYCYGGTMAWLASTRLPIDAAVGYYGGAIIKFVDEKPKAPVMLHFGGKDEHIPSEVREKIHAQHPEVPIYVYDDAGHAFDRFVDPTAYVEDAAVLARKRSNEFFAKHLGF